VRDRKKTHSLLYAGLFSMLTATILDVVGVSQAAGIMIRRFCRFSRNIYVGSDVMPVGVMLFIQILPKINPWLKGAAFGVTAAYILEPIFFALGFYEQSGWEHYYSLPIFFAIFMLGYRLYSGSLRECEKRKLPRSETP
jgi:hypothetical protein